MDLQEIIERMKAAGDAPLYVSGFVEGATWANEQNAQEIAELVEALRNMKTSMEKMHADAKAENQSFKLLPDERKVIQMAKELIEKYKK